VTSAVLELDSVIDASDGVLGLLAVVLLLLRWHARRRGRGTGRWTAAAALSVGSWAAVAWAKRVEPDLVEVTYERLELAANPLRVVVLADLHAGRSDRERLARAVQTSNAQAPDVVLLAGDYISGYELTEERREKLGGLRGLRAPGGVFAVLGNHDSEPYGDEAPRRARIARELESFGYRVLRNESVALTPGLWLAGVDEVQAGLGDAPRAFAAIPEPARRIALAHDWHALDTDVRFDLGLVGHTHGGQVCVPLTAVCAGPARNRPYVRGRHPWKRGGVLYVNRGIGLSKLALRFGCRPEITVFDLGPAR